MPRPARKPYEWLTLVLGLVAGLIWASHALRAVVMDEDPSTRALFAWAALVLVGFALGAVMWILAAPKRSKRQPSEVAALANITAPGTMLAITSIGLGASPIVDASTGVGDWALMVAGSLVGGLNLGVVFMRSTDQVSPSDALPRSAAAPPSDA